MVISAWICNSSIRIVCKYSSVGIGPRFSGAEIALHIHDSQVAEIVVDDICDGCLGQVASGNINMVLQPVARFDRIAGFPVRSPDNSGKLLFYADLRVTCLRSNRQSTRGGAVVPCPCRCVQERRFVFDHFSGHFQTVRQNIICVGGNFRVVSGARNKAAECFVALHEFCGVECESVFSVRVICRCDIPGRHRSRNVVPGGKRGC